MTEERKRKIFWESEGPNVKARWADAYVKKIIMKLETQHYQPIEVETLIEDSELA